MILASLLAATEVHAAVNRQFCLKCHSGHYEGRGNCTDCHRGNPLTDRKNIAHQQLIAGRYAHFTLGNVPVLKEGRRLIDHSACRRCHVIAGQGNRLAANLDVVARKKSPQELLQSIHQPAQGMPDFHINENGTTAIINALLSSTPTITKDERAQVVYFSRAGDGGQDIFSKKCGGCHRILSQKLGASGRGDIGPNLSGLLSSFYPKTFRNGGEWSADKLANWLKNPRIFRPWAQMQPVDLTNSERNDLETVITIVNKQEND